MNLESYEDVRGRGGLSREFTITYRSNLEANEKLVDGEWWDATPAVDQPEVSIEESLRERFSIQVGDEMRFDVLGRVITRASPASAKSTCATSAPAGSCSCSGPGRSTTRRTPTSPPFAGPEGHRRARADAGRCSSRSYPNVSVIDLREVLDTIKTSSTTSRWRVTVVGALVLFSGSLILIGAVSMTKFRRVYEAAILKTLGASSRLIATMLLLEYGVLGAIAGTVGRARGRSSSVGRSPATRSICRGSRRRCSRSAASS